MTKYAIKWDPPRRPKRRKRSNYMHGEIAMISPMDLIEEAQYTRHKLWELNLNFPIIASLHEEIEKVPGVEILLTFTPYKIQLGFGKLFDQNDVRRNIQTVLKKHIKFLKEMEDASIQQHS